MHATRVESSDNEGDSYVATIATSDPDRKLELVATAEADGVIQITVKPVSTDGVQALGIGFVAEQEERFVGFGERGNAVDQNGSRDHHYGGPEYRGALEHYVSDGPYYNDVEYGLMGELLPPPGTRFRPDATYFPIPWLLSSRGYGVLIDNDEMSYHRVAHEAPDAWSMEVETLEMQFRVFGGPTPVEALGRYTDAVGTQPNDYAPWFFGPWVQTDNDIRIAEARDADVPTSLNATYTHYLPCGSQQGNEEQQRIRTANNHDMGVAIHTYFNPMICESYEPPFSQSEAQGALVQDGDGETYIYDYCSDLDRCFRVGQFDFTADNGVSAYKTLTDEALDHGYDGWMEDFGEYTPLDAIAANGTTGTEFHNRYVRDYHCGVHEATADAGKPLARFNALWLGRLSGLFPDRLGVVTRPLDGTTTACTPRSFGLFRWVPPASESGAPTLEGSSRCLNAISPMRCSIGGSRTADYPSSCEVKEAVSRFRRMTGRSPGTMITSRFGACTPSSTRSCTRISRRLPSTTTRRERRSCSTTF